MNEETNTNFVIDDYCSSYRKEVEKRLNENKGEELKKLLKNEKEDTFWKTTFIVGIGLGSIIGVIIMTIIIKIGGYLG